MLDFTQLLTVEAMTALVALTALEIVLGIDNVIFIAILSEKLPEHQRTRARNIGLLLAMVQRIGLLLVIGWVIQLDRFYILDWGRVLESIGLLDAPAPAPAPVAGGAHATDGAHAHGGGDQRMSIKELILLLGGLFLIAKATFEIHHALEGDRAHDQKAKKVSTFGAVITQILLLDLVFSVDSVLTAIGLTTIVPAMIVAVVISVIVMIAFAGPISRFIAQHPTVKMLALAILVTIGLLLVVEAFEAHVPRGYLYFAMAFSLGVELLNIRAGKRRRATQAGAPAPE
jgi:predicted tellurium resistance membrane protein TerC